jgi:lysophospholipase
MSAPMLGFSTSPWPFFLVPPMLSLYEFLGLEQSYVVGGGKFDLEPYSPDNNLTSDEPHYTRNYQLMLDYPQIQLGAPTCAWVKKSLEAIKEIKNGAEKFKVPLLILQAGADRVVNNCAEKQFCSKVGKNCQLIVMPESQHEILMEKPEIRKLAEKYIFDFFNRATGF